MPILLNGRGLAQSLLAELKVKVAQLPFTPRLGVILVGDDPASHLYVNLKERAANEVGIAMEKILMAKNVLTEQVISEVNKFNLRPDVHGILVQLPLPQHIDEPKVIAAINPAKDADGFHPVNLANLLKNKPALVPGVSAGIMKLIGLANQPLQGKRACLIVNSQEFARPLSKLLQDMSIAVNICHLPKATTVRQADIVVVALGRPGFIKNEHLKDGAIVIDVGTTKVGDKVRGDVDVNSLAERQIYLTPVPGGVGPMTVAMLLWNVYLLAKRLV